MIIFSNVTYGYRKDKPILKNLSFHIQAGSFTALMGQSGAGKSTILWHIMGELAPSSGQMFCLGSQPGSLKGRKLMKYRRKVGYVPQDLLLLEHHNVYDNVNSVLCGMGLSAKEAAARTKNVLELVGLADRKKSMPSELSGGERQRLAIARALGIMPRVLIADEPTGNLDPEMSEEVMSLFKQIHEMGITVVVATHEQELMTRLGADILYITKGQPVTHTHADGSSIELTSDKQEHKPAQKQDQNNHEKKAKSKTKNNKKGKGDKT